MSFQSPPLNHSYHYVNETSDVETSFVKPQKYTSSYQGYLPPHQQIYQQEPERERHSFISGSPYEMEPSPAVHTSINKGSTSGNSEGAMKALQMYAHSKQQLAEQYQMELKMKNAENDRLQQEIAMLSREASMKQQLEKEFEKIKKIEEGLRKDYNELKINHAKQSSELDEIQGVQEELLLAIAEQKKKNSDLVDKGKGAESEMHRLLIEKERLELLVTTLQTERRGHEKALLEQRRELTDLMEQREKENKKEIEDLSEQLRIYKSSTNELTEELHEAKKDIENLRDQADKAEDLEDQVSQLTSNCNNLQSENDLLEDEKREHIEKIEYLESTLSDLRTTVSKLENKGEELKKEVDLKTHHITQLKTQLNQLSESKAQEKSQMDLHVNSLLKILNGLKTEVTKKDQTIAQLRSNNSSKQSPSDNEDKLKREVESCQEVIKTLKDANTKLEDRVEKGHKIISALETKLHKAKEDRQLLAELLTKYKSSNSSNSSSSQNISQ